MDVYLTTGSIKDNEPIEFNYDVVFRQKTYVKITSDMIGSNPKFAVAMLINGLIYYTNTTQMSTFNASFTIYDKLSGKAISRSASAQSQGIEIPEVIKEHIPKSWKDVGIEHVLLVICVLSLIYGLFRCKKTAKKTESSESHGHQIVDTTAAVSYQQLPAT